MLRVWPVPGACAEARHAVREFCADTPVAGFADDAELLTSEIVTNSIVHSASLITLVAVLRGRELVVTVSDDVRAFPVVNAAADDAEHGRGMQVVAQLAGAWGVTPRTFGKTVWFRLP
jgi:hypothetical protein